MKTLILLFALCFSVHAQSMEDSFLTSEGISVKMIPADETFNQFARDVSHKLKVWHDGKKAQKKIQAQTNVLVMIAKYPSHSGDTVVQITADNKTSVVGAKAIGLYMDIGAEEAIKYVIHAIQVGIGRKVPEIAPPARPKPKGPLPRTTRASLVAPAPIQGAAAIFF